MRAFTSAELAAMQATQGSAMQDTCIHLAFTEGGVDSYGMPAVSYEEAETLSCGFQPSTKAEAMKGTEVVLADALLRLPVDTEVDARDRFQITERFGVSIEAETYQVLGIPERGPSGLVVKLERVTDGS